MNTKIAAGFGGSHEQLEAPAHEQQEQMLGKEEPGEAPEPNEAQAGPAGGPEQGDDPDFHILHTPGGTGVVLSPDVLHTLAKALVQDKQDDPHGVLIILPSKGADRAVHFNPIPAEACQDPQHATQIMHEWEMKHQQGDTEPDQDADDDTQAPDGPSPLKSPPFPATASNPGVPPQLPPKLAGYIAGLLNDLIQNEPMSKTAGQINGQGLGMASMIDALVKGGGYTLEEMMNHLANTGRIENPELVRRMGKGQR